MTTAQLTLRLPEGTWIGDVSTAHPSARFRVLAALPGSDAGFGLVEVVATEPRPILADMDGHQGLTRTELLRAGEGRALIQFETTQPLLLFSARESQLPIQLPIEISDGQTTFELTASHDRLSELSRQFETYGIDHEIDYRRSRDDSERLLTDRQRELLSTAIEMGYYDTPRGASMTDLADELGIAKSTCSETLHRAEETVVKQFAEREFRDTDPAAVEPR